MAHVWEERSRETLPRRRGGVDWGAERWVVMRAGSRVLAWTPGHNAWVSRGRTGYYDGCLTTFAGDHGDVLGGAVTGKLLAEGGRLAAHLRDPALLAKIADHFGCAVAELPAFRCGKTYVRES